jgi:D-sedoheptulose 7-phosphate isomerase
MTHGAPYRENILAENLGRSIRAMQALALDAGQLEMFARMSGRLVDCYRAGGRLYAAGNGGSAAEAQHMVVEFVSRLARDRAPLPAETLSCDGALLTAIGNDYGFELVFARQLAGKMTERDVFLGITTSGNSPNILQALRICREIGAASMVLTGPGGGEAINLADFGIRAPGETTSAVQELHLILTHSLCQSVERAMFGDK